MYHRTKTCQSKVSQFKHLEVYRNVATQENILAIKKWNYKDDADNKYLEHNFTEQIDYILSTIHLEDHFQMYKSKAIYSIHYFSHTFVILVFVLSEYTQDNYSSFDDFWM